MHEQTPETQNNRRFPVTLFERRTDTNGKRIDQTWPELRECLEGEPEITQSKDGSCFVFGEVAADRDGQVRHKKALVQEIHALAIDVDDASTDAIASMVHALGARGLEFCGWPTFTQLDAPKEGLLRCRLVFPLSRPVRGVDWGRFWSAAVDYLGVQELADAQCKDASRLYFHTCPAGKQAEFSSFCQLLANSGAPLDVDAVLASAPVPRAAVEPSDVPNLNAAPLLDGGLKIERCPRGTSAFQHAENLARSMPPAVSGSGGHVALLRLARALRWGLELDEAQTVNLITELYNARCEPPWSDTEISHKVEHAGAEDGAPYKKGALLPPVGPEFAALLDTDEDGKPNNTTANIATILGLHPAWFGVLRFDLFGNRTLCVKAPPMRDHDAPKGEVLGPWNDAHSARARTWITSEYGFEPSKDAVESAVDIAAHKDEFHPVQEYLHDLEWDRVQRLEAMLCQYFGAADTRYTRTVGSKFMISAVARAMKPGCKVDTMLILEGKQGTKKSTAVRMLASDAWFADTPLDLESKDAAQCLAGKWLYEIGELASFNRSETNRIKAFVSSLSDNLRPSFGRRNQDFPRQCVFVGTTNGTEYLSDTTGNRRYWPVECGAIDVEGLRRDRDQLWAEAVVQYFEGETWWLDSDVEALATAEQGEREAADPWEDQLSAWADKRDSFTMQDALSGLGVSLEHQTSAQAVRVGKLLAKLNYKRTRPRAAPGEKRDRRYGKTGPGGPGETTAGPG